MVAADRLGYCVFGATDCAAAAADAALRYGSQPPVGAPVFFVRKKDGPLRLVVDYWPLNRITMKFDYPMPRIQDLIIRLGEARWFTKLDLQKGYYQVEIAKEEQRKSAFKTR